MARRMPYMQFYPGDWARDTRPLSLAARGAWIDLVCAMWDAPDRGVITLPEDALARLMGASGDETAAVLEELERCGVCDVKRSCNGDVTVVCRRMVREERARSAARKRVAAHRDRRGCNNDAGVSRTVAARACNCDVTPKKRGGNGDVTREKLEVRSQKQKPQPLTHTETVQATERGASESESDAVAIPEHVLAQGRQVLGLTCDATLLHWLRECEYPPGWISRALAETEARSPNAPRQYAARILQTYRTQGGPHNGNGKCNGKIAIGSGGVAAATPGKFAGWG